MSNTLLTIETRICDELAIGISLASFDAAAAGSITASRYLQNSNWSNNRFLDHGIWRPSAATSADTFRFAGLLTNTSGLLAHTGANYADTTATSEPLIILEKGIDPEQDIQSAINRALERIFYHAWEPLSLAPDAAMRESGTGSWGTAVNASGAKTTTAARIFPGFIRALAVTNSAANGYMPTATINVVAGEPVFVAAFSRVNSGTAAQMILYDNTGSATFGQTQTHTSSIYQYMWQLANVPTGCRAMTVRLGGTGSADVTDWQALWVVQPNEANVFNLPSSYIDERFKLESLARGRYLMGGTSSGIEQAYAQDLEEIPTSDYSPDFMQAAANPSFIQFHNRRWLNNYPLWMQMRLPWSEQGTFTSNSGDTGTTNAPLHLILAASKLELLKGCPAAAKVSPITVAMAQKEFDDAQRARTTVGPANRKSNTGFLAGLRN